MDVPNVRLPGRGGARSVFLAPDRTTYEVPEAGSVSLAHRVGQALR